MSKFMKKSTVGKVGHTTNDHVTNSLQSFMDKLNKKIEREIDANLKFIKEKDKDIYQIIVKVKSFHDVDNTAMNSFVSGVRAIVEKSISEKIMGVVEALIVNEGVSNPSAYYHNLGHLMEKVAKNSDDELFDHRFSIVFGGIADFIKKYSHSVDFSPIEAVHSYILTANKIFDSTMSTVDKFKVVNVLRQELIVNKGISSEINEYVEMYIHTRPSRVVNYVMNGFKEEVNEPTDISP